MAIIQRITTWAALQLLKSADLNGEFNNIVNLINNVDSATTTWDNVKTVNLVVTTLATVPNGVNSTDAAAFGQIFTGFQALVQATDTTNHTTSSSTFSNTTLAASITPTSASHRIKISISAAFSVDNAATSVQSTIARGATNIGGTHGFAQAGATAVGAGGLITLSYSYIDSPATTSSTTYTMQIASTDNTNNVEYAPGTAVKNVIILEEIV